MHAYHDRMQQPFVNGDSQLYVDVVINKCRHLMSLSIDPVFVFDGKRNCLKVILSYSNSCEYCFHIFFP
jgi:hypothetical protein